MAWNKPGNGNSGNKDPWGSRRGGQQGPPDLDEIVRNIQMRLSGLFGGGRRGGGGGGRIGNLRAGGIGAGALLIAALLLWGISGFYIVQQAERGVVLRFGKLQDIVATSVRAG
jgi:membrane protease subunit HflK